jgi:hypothetical protein
MVAACSVFMQQSPSENEKTFSFWGLRPRRPTPGLCPIHQVRLCLPQVYNVLYHRRLVEKKTQSMHNLRRNKYLFVVIYLLLQNWFNWYICEKIWAFLKTPFLLKCALSVVKNARTDTHKFKKNLRGVICSRTPKREGAIPTPAPIPITASGRVQSLRDW